MATHSSILAWKNPMAGGAWQATVPGVAKSRTRLSTFTFFLSFLSEAQWDHGAQTWSEDRHKHSLQPHVVPSIHMPQKHTVVPR